MGELRNMLLSDFAIYDTNAIPESIIPDIVNYINYARSFSMNYDNYNAVVIEHIGNKVVIALTVSPIDDYMSIEDIDNMIYNDMYN